LLSKNVLTSLDGVKRQSKIILIAYLRVTTGSIGPGNISVVAQLIAPVVAIPRGQINAMAEGERERAQCIARLHG
jgi:hypothetical protein